MNVHTGIGASILRKEDRRFITGKGNYVAVVCEREEQAINAARRLKADDISEKTIARHLYAPDMPDPDVMVRTSGEYRDGDPLFGREIVASNGRLHAEMQQTIREFWR